MSARVSTPAPISLQGIPGVQSATKTWKFNFLCSQEGPRRVLVEVQEIFTSALLFQCG